MVRLGLIGAGRWGRNYIRTLREIPDVSLACVVSQNPQTKELVGEGCAVLGDVEELLRAKGLDGVIIAAPPALHVGMAQACLEKNLAVLVEKPLALDAEESRRLLADAQRLNGLVLVDHIYLFHSAYQALKERAKSLGPLKALKSRGGNWGPFRNEVGPLWDYGSHDISLCLDFMGKKPTYVKARRLESRRMPEGAGETISLRLEFQDVTAEITLGNLMLKRERSFSAIYDKESLIFDDTQPCPGEPPLTKAVNAFARMIRERRRDLSSLSLGVDVVETLARAQAALRP